jgi:hypothetical protein
LNGEDSRTLAAAGTFRVVPKQDLDIDQGAVDHLRNEGLVATVDLGDDERGWSSRRTAETCSMRTPWSATMRPSHAFYAGVEGGNSRENAEFGLCFCRRTYQPSRWSRVRVLKKGW